MAHWYQHAILDSGKQPLAVLFVSFVVTFAFIRFSVRMIRAEVKWWPGNVSAGGTHIHHVIFGLVFMLIAGAGGFSQIGNYRPWAEIFAGLFGCGAALVLDEFALVLHLRDVYWSEQGRTSVDAVFLAVAVLALLLIGVAPFGANDVKESTGEPTTAWSYVFGIGFNSVLVVLALAKGKVWTGLFGILIPLIAFVGAIRLARPGSPWARWRYRPGSRKQIRSADRDGRWRQRWVERRQRLQDLLAGRPS